MAISKNAKTGRWQSRFRDSTGKQQQFTSAKYFPAGLSKRDAQKVELEIIQDLEAFIEKGDQPLIDDMLDDWLENHASKLVQPESYKHHVDQIRPFTKGYTIHEVVDVGRTIIQVHKNRGMKPATVNQRMNPLRQIAKKAFLDDILKTDVSLKLRSEAPKKEKELFLTLEEVDVLASHAPNDMIADLIIFFAHTGIRLAEALRIEEGDIWAGRLSIKGKAKNGHKMRTLQLSEKAADAASRLTFPIPIGKHQMSHGILEAKKAAKYEDKMDGWHTLRHSYATFLARSGQVSIQKLQYLMGHATLAMTNRYSHLIPEDCDGAADLFNNHKSELQSHRK